MNQCSVMYFQQCSAALQSRLNRRTMLVLVIFLSQIETNSAKNIKNFCSKYEEWCNVELTMDKWFPPSLTAGSECSVVHT